MDDGDGFYLGVNSELSIMEETEELHAYGNRVRAPHAFAYDQQYHCAEYVHQYIRSMRICLIGLGDEILIFGKICPMNILVYGVHVMWWIRDYDVTHKLLLKLNYVIQNGNRDEHWTLMIVYGFFFRIKESVVEFAFALYYIFGRIYANVHQHFETNNTLCLHLNVELDELCA